MDDKEREAMFGDWDAQFKVESKTNTFINFFMNLWNAVSLYNSSIIDPVLTKKLNGILKGGGNVSIKQVQQWVVRIIPAPEINAFVAYPFSYIFDPGKGTIFLYAGIVKLMGRNSDELIGVILHEVGHFVKFHLPLSLVATFGKATLATHIFKWLLKFIKGGSGKGKALLIGSLLILATITLSAAWAFVSRTNERAADDFVIQYGYGEGLTKALAKMAKFSSISGLKPTCGKMCQSMNKIENAFSSHPATKERVETILNSDKLWKAMQKKKKGRYTEMLMTEIVKMVKEEAIAKRGGIII